MPARARVLVLALLSTTLGSPSPRASADSGAPPAPLSLTASDGTGLVLAALDARVVVSDPLAFTELRLVFDNPEPRVLEGQFRITLPRGASVSRFAMKTDAGWQEGEVVELQAARRAYEDFLHRRQDPALLEQAAGNEFSARVFPIPAKGQKELIVSYSQELASATEPFVLPLAGLPKVGRLDVRVQDATLSPARVTELHEQAYTPRSDFSFTPVRPEGRVGLREGELAVVRVRPVTGTPADPPRSLAVLLDTSASRGLGLAQAPELLTALSAAVARAGGADAPLALFVFDQTAELAWEGKALSLGEEAFAKVARRGALGASDLEGALRFVGRTLAGSKGKYSRLVVVSDGVITAGLDDGDALKKAAVALGAVGIERLDALAVGGIRDESTLARLTSCGLVRDGAVLDGNPLSVAVDRLGRATRSALKVKADGAAWVWPERLDGVLAGDDVLVFASLPAGTPLRVTVGQTRFEPAPSALGHAEPLLLARAATHARLQKLLAARDDLAADQRDAREELRHQIVSLSTKQRVLTPLTALLVLETEADYARFQLNRRGLADILTVGDQGLTVVDRRTSAPLVQAPPPPPRRVLSKAKSADGGGAAPGEAAGPEEARESEASRAVAEAMPPEPAADAAGAAAADEAAPAATLAGAGAAARADAPALAPPSPAMAPPPPPRPSPVREEVAPRRAMRPRVPAAPAPSPEPVPDQRVAAFTGPFAEVMELLAHDQAAKARERAVAWHAASPGDVLALVALGEVSEKLGENGTAARAYGSLVDLFPNRADLRRFAGERLERLKSADAQALAVDTFRRAAAQRPDHPASHRLLGFALLRRGDYAGAFEALAAGLARDYPEGRFAEAHRILAEDLGLATAAWIRAEPARARELDERRAKAGGVAETEPSLRFVLIWETDANDVDFHIFDGKGNHAFYQAKELASGGSLYADVTTGYGPECFTIRGKPRAYPYTLQAHYYSRGPMGYGMGKLEIIAHDGHGNLRFEERPFVVMQDNAFVDLGMVSQ